MAGRYADAARLPDSVGNVPRRRFPYSGVRPFTSYVPLVPPGTLQRVLRPAPRRAGATFLQPDHRVTSLLPDSASTSSLPRIIQGGMGIGVSNWRLANAVSRLGQLGVISGTVIDTVFVRRLQDGDPGGHVRRALAHLPIPGVADELLQRYFRPEGRLPGEPFHLLPMYKQVVSAARQRVTVAAAFVETWLARDGHPHPVGLNLLTKVQRPNLPTLYGAMLAGVSNVIMGAGIPREIPGALDALATHAPASLKFDVEGLARDESLWLTFDPADVWPERQVPLTPCTARRSIRWSRRCRWRRRRRASRTAGGMASWSKDRRPAATTPHHAAPCSSMRWGSPSTANATPWISPGSVSSACPSGWRAAWPHQRGYSPPARQERRASRWERCSPTARNRG